MNREQRRKTEKEVKAPNLVASGAASQLLESAAIIVQSMKGGTSPTQFEVIGLATVILNDVFNQQVEEQQKDGTEATEEEK